MLLASVFGVLMGLVLGLTGAGGGILAVPALVLGLGLSMTQAAPVALLAVGSAAAVGAIDGLRHGLVRYRAALLIALLGAVFSPVGIFFAHQLPERVLMVLFSGLMVMVAWRMLRRERHDDGPSDHGHANWGQKNCMLDQHTGRFSWTAKCTATLAALGAVTGVVSGLLGVGGRVPDRPGIQATDGCADAWHRRDLADGHQFDLRHRRDRRIACWRAHRRPGLRLHRRQRGGHDHRPQALRPGASANPASRFRYRVRGGRDLYVAPFAGIDGLTP